MLIDQILTELKASAGYREVILTGQQSRLELIKFLNSEEKGFKRILRIFWKEQREEITIEVARRIISQGHTVPQDIMDSLTKGITHVVGEKIEARYMDSIEYSGNFIAGKINRMRKQEFEFNKVSANILDWMSEQGGDLIVQLTATQYKTINVLLQHQVFQGITSPYIMAQRLKPLIPLLQRDALAVTRLYEELSRAGLSQDMILRQTGRVADNYLNNRAMTIARTELSGAYGNGQLESVRQAAEGGFLPGLPEKEWMAGGGNPCDICLDNEGEGPIPINQTFSSGDDTHPAHPKCECSVGYSIRR